MQFSCLQEALDALEEAVERRDHYDAVDIVMWIENDCGDDAVTDTLLFELEEVLERLEGY